MWPQEYEELKHIEDLLVCGICYEYMETSVITSCSHNYCSLCIRKYLHYKTQCPTCFAETFEKDLRKNKVLDDIITYFSQVKDKLKRCFRGPIQIAQSNGENILYKPTFLDQSKDGICLNKQQEKVINNCTTPRNIGSPLRSVQQDLSSPSTSGKHKAPIVFTPKGVKNFTPTKRVHVTKLDDTKVVTCPVCKVTISEANINRHLDDCLRREDKIEKPQIVESPRKPLPKLVYSLMKDGVLRKKLKEYGLSSQGDRKALETRLQRYIVIYNAECDKLDPRPVSELLKQCEDEENVEKKNNKTSLFLSKLQVNRRTEQNVIDDERKKYLEAHKDSFESLIKKIKSIDTTKKSSARRSILDESINDDINTPYKKQAGSEDSIESLEDEKNDFGPLNYNNTDVQNSDSDTSCPLQIYSSIDPRKLNVNAPASSVHDTSISESQESNDKKKNDEQEFNPSNYSVYRKLEEHDTSLNSCLNASIETNVGEQSTKGSVFEEDMLKSDSDTCNSSINSERKTIIRKRTRTLKRSQIKKINSVIGIADAEFDKLSDTERIEHENIAPALQDFTCDMSSNDSTDCRSNCGKTDNEFECLNTGITNIMNLEKENISSSPECTDYQSFRKRNRDTVQNEKKDIFSAKKKVKGSPKIYISETEDSNSEESTVSVLQDNENKRSRKKLRMRRDDLNESAIGLRKSNRIRHKSNV